MMKNNQNFMIVFNDKRKVREALQKQINDKDFVEVLECLHEYYVLNRHPLFHSNQISIQTKMIDLETARQIVADIEKMLKDSYKRLFEEIEEYPDFYCLYRKDICFVILKGIVDLSETYLKKLEEFFQSKEFLNGKIIFDCTLVYGVDAFNRYIATAISNGKVLNYLFVPNDLDICNELSKKFFQEHKDLIKEAKNLTSANKKRIMKTL